MALLSNSRGLKGPVSAKDGAGSGPQTLAGSWASAVIIQPWSPLVLQVLQLLEDDLEEWRDGVGGNSGAQIPQGSVSPPLIQPPASLLDVCYSTDTPGGGVLCRTAGQRLLGPHSCLPRSDYFSQTGAGWEVGVFTFKSFMCVHFTLCGWAWRAGEGGFQSE